MCETVLHALQVHIYCAYTIRGGTLSEESATFRFIYFADFYNQLQALSWKKSYAAFRLTCRLPHCRFDDDICTTAQAPLAAEG